MMTRRQSIGHALATVRDAVLAIVVVPIVAPVWLLPWTAATRLGRWYGYAVWAVSARSRRIGLINLRRAFGPGMPERDARRTVRAVYGHLGQSIAEGMQLGRRLSVRSAILSPPPLAGILASFGGSPKRRRREGGRLRSLRIQRASGAASERPQRVGIDRLPSYECDNPELERRILDDPRPKVFVTGHLGSWELASGIAAARAGRDGAVIFRRVDNPFLDALWRRVRPLPDAEWIEKRGAAARAAAALRAGRSIALLADENGGYRGIFVPFFGRPASTHKTAAVLSLTTGAPIVLGACIRRPGRPFRFRLAMFEPPVQLEPGRAVHELTARVVATLEAWIRDDPAQWRWVHWRWKTRPDGSEERYGRAELREAFRHADGLPPSRCGASASPRNSPDFQASGGGKTVPYRTDAGRT